MDDAQVGRSVRVVRVRLGLRQRDLGAKAGVSQQTVSMFELGQLENMSLGSIRRIARAVDGYLGLTFGWRGATLDRLIDERHAVLVSRIKRVLEIAGWKVELEVSYSEYGERGSIDLLAWHEPTRTMLIVEVKTEIGSVEATLRKHDEKVRLAPLIARRRFGWSAREVSRLLVLPDSSTPRRQVSRFSEIFERAYPSRGTSARRWLRQPAASIRSLIFLSPTAESGGRRSSVAVRRVRGPSDGTPMHESCAKAGPGRRSRQRESPSTITTSE